jgi:hypothetical protein
MKNAFIILTLLFFVVSFKAPVAWLFVIFFGVCALYCLLTAKSGVDKTYERDITIHEWEDTVASVFKDCPFCRSKVMKSAKVCPYCGELFEDHASKDTGEFSKKREGTVESEKK